MKPFTFMPIILILIFGSITGTADLDSGGVGEWGGGNASASTFFAFSFF